MATGLITAWREDVMNPLVQGDTFADESTWNVMEDDPEKPLVIAPRQLGKLKPLWGAEFTVVVDMTRQRIELVTESNGMKTTIVSVGAVDGEASGAENGGMNVVRTVRRVENRLFRNGQAEGIATYGGESGLLERIEAGVPHGKTSRHRTVALGGLSMVVQRNPLSWTHRLHLERWMEVPPGSLDPALTYGGRRKRPANRFGVGVDVYRNNDGEPLARAEMLYRRRGERDETHRIPLLPDVPFEADPEKLFRVFQRAVQVVLGVKIEQPQAKNRASEEQA